MNLFHLHQFVDLANQSCNKTWWSQNLFKIYNKIVELGNFVLILVILSLFYIKVTSNIEKGLYLHNNFRVIMYQVQHYFTVVRSKSVSKINPNNMYTIYLIQGQNFSKNKQKKYLYTTPFNSKFEQFVFISLFRSKGDEIE